MQSALGSLRQAGPSKRVFIDAHTAAWGIGSDNLSSSGHYRFRVLKGSVSLCGITLTEPATNNNNNENINNHNNNEQAFYTVSAPVAPYPTITANHHISNATDHGFDELSEFPAIIEVRSSSLPDIGELAPPYKQSFHPTYQVKDEETFVQIPDSWKSIELNTPKFVLLGPKNSGKSNLSRFLCNRLISLPKKPRVFYSELDPGQPEFTVPGCLSSHEISDSNFSAGYFHPDFRNTLKCSYLGYISPSETPDRYLDMCHELFSHYYHVKNTGDFLVVNTPGWTKGLGLELNSEIVTMAEDVDSFELQVSHLGDSSGFGLDLIELDGFNNDEKSGSTITQGGYSSAESRSLQIINYLHQSNLAHLTEWAPYEVRFSNISIGVLDSAGLDSNEDLGICIEGTVVAVSLLANDDESEGRSKECILNEQDTNNLWRRSEVIGMAVVQRLNSNSINLLMPVTPSDLGITPASRVVLIRGRVQLPMWELYNKKSGNAPWVTMSKGVGVGGSYTKFRRNIQR